MSKELEILGCLHAIQDMCIGSLTMNYNLDAEYIGHLISKTTGMTSEELNTFLIDSEKDEKELHTEVIFPEENPLWDTCSDKLERHVRMTGGLTKEEFNTYLNGEWNSETF